MFLKRDYSPEIMDDSSIQDERIDQALLELKTINRYLGGNSVTSAGLEILLNKNHNPSPVILDAGAGGSDLFEKEYRNAHLQLLALDKNKRVCLYLSKKGKGNIPVCGDVTLIPFTENSIDITHCSLLLHHFNESELLTILKSFILISRQGIIINDLRRSVLAYIGIKLLTVIFSSSDMVKNDGPLSVKKGFTKKDLVALMDKLNIKSYVLKRKWAFRWLLVIYIK